MFKWLKKRNKYLFTNEDREQAEEVRNFNKKLKDLKKESQYLKEKYPLEEKKDSKQDLLIGVLIGYFGGSIISQMNKNKQDSKDKTEKDKDMLRV